MRQAYSPHGRCGLGAWRVQTECGSCLPEVGALTILWDPKPRMLPSLLLDVERVYELRANSMKRTVSMGQHRLVDGGSIGQTSTELGLGRSQLVGEARLGEWVARIVTNPAIVYQKCRAQRRRWVSRCVTRSGFKSLRLLVILDLPLEHIKQTERIRHA